MIKRFCSVLSLALFLLLLALMPTYTVVAEQTTHQAPQTLQTQQTPQVPQAQALEAEDALRKASDGQEKIDNELERQTGKKSEQIINNSLEIKPILLKTVSLFLQEVKTSFRILLQIVAIAIFSGLLRAMGIRGSSTTSGIMAAGGLGAFGGASTVATLFCSIATITISVSCASDVLNSINGIIEAASAFIQATFPAMITLTAVSGYGVAGAAISPMLLFVSGIGVSVVQTLIMPALSLSLSLAAIETLTGNRILCGVSTFIRRCCYVLISVLTTIFTAVTALKGIIGSSAGLGSSRLIKYSLKFIPIVGDMAADSLETIAGSLSIIKNVSGVAVILVLVAIVAGPVLRIFAISLMYKLASVIVTTIDNESSGAFIKEVGDTIAAAGGMVVAVGIMFLVVVAALVMI